MCIEQIRIHEEHPLCKLKIKMIIQIILEPRYKNFEGQYEIEEPVKNIYIYLYQAPHVYTNGF
jgi:hypothetical protein